MFFLKRKHLEICNLGELLHYALKLRGIDTFVFSNYKLTIIIMK